MEEFNLLVRDIDFARLMALRPPPNLRTELERAIVVPGDSIPVNIVTMGASVGYRDQKTGHCREIELVYPDEADLDSGKISVLTPVGSALIGLAEGQEIDWHFPDGTPHRLKVMSVKQAEQGRPPEIHKHFKQI
ncbi:MAG: nucleoside diphosphate kinase regulator [Rhodocyclaceae bacterium]